MKKFLSILLFSALILSLALSAGAVSVNQVFAYSDPNWSKGNSTTADGLWKYEWFARETETFASMDWNASGSYYEAQFTEAAASDTHWYCRIRSNGTNLHPGAQADAVLTFVCPESGKVQYAVNLTRQSDPNPSGNTVRLMKNTSFVPINGAQEDQINDKTTYSIDVTVDVQKGDLLRLMIGSQGNSSADGVNLSGLKVKYLSGANLEPEKPSYTITCVGDSITEGMGTSGGLKGANAYPTVLAGLLRKTGVADFVVNNCGKSATTALTKGDRPYKQCSEYKTSLKTDPDIVIICLGANDSKKANWNAAQYELDYKNLIKEYMNLASKPTVYLFYTTYVADQSKTGCTRTVIQNEILPIQDDIAKDLGLKIIDLNTLTKKNSTKYADGVHPNDELQAMMAEYIFNALCAEGVCGLSAKNATATVSMIDPSKTSVSTDTSSGSVSSSETTNSGTVTDTSSASDTATDTATDAATDSATGSTAGSQTDSATVLPTDSQGTDGNNAENNGWIVWVIVAAGIVVVGAAAICLILFLKKGKK